MTLAAGRTSRAFFWTLSLSLLLAGPVSAKTERILSFDSAVTVQPDASLRVVETISVAAEGQDIKHGIYREFPTLYRDKKGLWKHRVGFTVLDVQRDGHQEPYHTASLSNGVRLYIGDKNVLLKPGVYRYTITYSTDRQLGFFKDHDELYWNVTGNGWKFPIATASCAVTLPVRAAAHITETNAFTGPQNAKGRDFEVERRSDGRVIFKTTQPLGQREGLTIVVSWAKGLVPEPTRLDRFKFFARDNPGIIAGSLAAVVLLLYYLVVWVLLGRDPRGGTIIPLFHAPKGLSPAAVRVIKRKGYDIKAFAAAITSAAVKGYFKISEKSQKSESFILEKTGKRSTKPLSSDETIVMEIFGKKETCVLEPHKAKIIGTSEKFQKHLLKACEKVYFITNIGWFALGIFLSLIFAVVIGFAVQVNMENVFIGIWGCFIIAMGWSAARQWWDVSKGGGSPKTACIQTVVMLFIGTICVAAFMHTTDVSSTVFTLLFFVSLAAIHTAFYHFLKALTRGGRKILDEIEGFLLFLSTTERERLKAWDPPEDTLELYERFLPYAIALDVEEKWSRRFAQILKDCEDSECPLSWYTGNRYWGTGLGSNFGSSFSSSLSSSVISSASAAPGSGGGGGGGGGSSGGGGGGGGGGGW